jgi:hypothetical protein
MMLGLGSSSIVATMPPLPASACTASQTYVPPGSNMGPQYGNQITTTGACINSVASPTTTAANWFTDPTQEVISGVPNWGLLAGAGVAALVFFGGFR